MVDNENKRLVFFILVGTVLFSGFILLLYWLSGGFNSNPYGDEVTIKNYDSKVKNLPAYYKDSFSAMLFEAVKLNSDGNITANDIKGAVIREGSEKQETITSGAQYTGTFIVDIESVKQSYRVQYSYSSNKDDTLNSGYPLLVSCLEKSELIYGDFNCKNTYSQGEKNDPIIGITPYSTLNYEIRSIKVAEEPVIVKINILLSGADYKSGNLKRIIETRKSEALNWMRSKGLDPSNYTIEYSH